MSQENDREKPNLPAQHASVTAANPPLFHARPVAVAALGLLFGLLIGDGFPLVRAGIAAVVLLSLAVFAVLSLMRTGVREHGQDV